MSAPVSLKAHLRSGLSSMDDRRCTWPKVALPIDEDDDPIAVSHRLCKLLKDPTLLSSNCDPHKFAKIGDFVTECRSRILSGIEQHKSIANTSHFESIITIIAYTMKNIEVSYYMISALIDQNNRYSFAIEGDRRLYIMSETFKDILASFIPKTYAVLCQLRALQPHFLAVFFNDFFLDIFPTNILLNMIDSFLLEGIKILYRYGAAVICLYKSRIKSGSFTSADDFWSTVKREALLSATTMTHAQDGIKQDCRLLPDILGFAPQQLSLLSPTSEPSAKSNKLVFSVSVLKQRAFDMERGLGSKLMHPLNISRTYLQRKHQYYYMQFDNPKGRAEDDDRRDAVASSGGACRTESQAGLYNGDDNHNDSPPPSPIPVRTIFKLPSAYLSSEQIAVLGAALPETSQWIRWVERYTANRDGWDLNHVFQLLNKKTPILLLFYLQAPYEDTVIGALHGDVIAPPNPTQIRGQGTINRVFVLNNGQLMCYPWVGLLQTQPGVFAPDAQISGNTATQHQFAVSSADFLAFGGSHEHFTNALRWEAANTGVIMTGHSDTYQNPPLMIPTGADSHQNSSYSFPIREVEIFSGP